MIQPVYFDIERGTQEVKHINIEMGEVENFAPTTGLADVLLSHGMAFHESISLLPKGRTPRTAFSILITGVT